MQTKMLPSIFNDVLGPVMRGPSSSHCAASLRIGRICRDLMGGKIENAVIRFDPVGSLATTHKSQGSDMGLFGGFLGWEADDERLRDYEEAVARSGMNIHISIDDIEATHPNTYQIELSNQNGHHSLRAISTGGGMLEIEQIDGAEVAFSGDLHETLVYVEDPGKVTKYCLAAVPADGIHFRVGPARSFVQIRTRDPIETENIEEISALEGVSAVVQINPVLPILSGKNISVPFQTCEEMLAYNLDRNLELWQLAIHYESARGGISGREVLQKMREIIGVMRRSVENGLRGTDYHDRILGPQSLGFKEKLQADELIRNDALNRAIMYISAIMETKSSMGVIVAAPTAGSCGAMPGTLLALADLLQLSEDEVVRGFLSAGMIGLFIAAHATFAAEVGGCQAECGSGSGMAAAGLVTMMGGTLEQALSASSMALQNSLGMICDPIANRVEAPCLGRNVMAGSNAISCANMALANYNHLIPLDQVIETMDHVGKAIASDLRCTALGGLSITKASLDIQRKLAGDEALSETFQKFKIC